MRDRHAGRDQQKASLRALVALAELSAAALPAARGPVGRAKEHDELLSEWDRMTTGETPQPGIQIYMDPDPEPEPAAPAESELAAAAEAEQVAGEPATEHVHAESTGGDDTPLGEALAAVVLDPYGGALLNRLTELAEQVQASLRNDEVDAALRALAIVVDLEPGAPDGSPRNSYGI